MFGIFEKCKIYIRKAKVILNQMADWRKSDWFEESDNKTHTCMFKIWNKVPNYPHTCPPKWTTITILEQTYSKLPMNLYKYFTILPQYFCQFLQLTTDLNFL